MKLRYIFYGLTPGLLFGLSSYSLGYDPTDTYPDVTRGMTDIDARIVFKDKAVIESHLATIYNQIRDRQEHWYVDLLLISDLHADNTYAGTTRAEVLSFENNSIEGSNSVLERDWSRCLEDVARANKLICNTDLVTNNSLTTAERAQYKTEVVISRTVIVFNMVCLWGDFLAITTVTDDITSENIEDVYEQYFPAQSTELGAYQQVEKGLLAAIQHAPDNTASNKTLFTKSMARTPLAKIYVEKPSRDYSKVIRYCNEVKAGSFGFVEDLSDLPDMNAVGAGIRAHNTKESILEAQFAPGLDNQYTWMLGRDLVDWNNNFIWAKWVTPPHDSTNAFKREGDQIRFQESAVYYDRNWNNYYPSDSYPLTYKYRSANSSTIKYRYADVLLLKAEALTIQSTPDLEVAAKIIGEARERARLGELPSFVYKDRDAMITVLLNERRLELTFGGQHWFDPVRLDEIEEVVNVVCTKGLGRKSQVYVFDKSSYRLPIPQSAIDANDKIEQNPGY